MKVFDLNQLKKNSLMKTDLCIIGTGPAGLSIANEFAGAGTRVLVLESGGLETEPDTQHLYTIESTGACRVVNQDILRTRILGGSSHVWTGRCAPFDSLDFEQRSWIPFSGWPFGLNDLEPFLQRAAVYLGLAPGSYDESLWQRFDVHPPQPAINDPDLRNTFWQFSKSRHTRGSAHFGKDWTHADCENIEILLHANVTHINLTADGKGFESIEVSTLDGRRARVQAKNTVLCCGGIENARLLLASNRVISEGVANKAGLVGRFLMDHVSSSLGHFEATLSSNLRARFGHYWIDDPQGRHTFLHGLGLTAKAQESHRLLNCHAYLEEIGPAENDPWSALKRLKASANSRKIELSDARLVLTHARELGKGLYRRRVQHRPQLPIVNRVELHLMLEQMPDPESRITLSPDKRDALGMPLSRLHWKISDMERHTARRMLQLFTAEMKHLGLPCPMDIPELSTHSEWSARCNEKAHPSGTTRMAVSPQEGVVDANCQVHGIRGLFVAGSSIFPTVGAANPTLMVVATSLRLADHLKKQASAADGLAGTTSPSLREMYESQVHSPPSAMRVGIVGASRRILNLYLPILRQLSNKYRVVGFTTFSTEGFRRFESATGIESFRSAAELVAEAKPELLILAVQDRLNERVLTDLLDLKVPILAETPLAWSGSGTRRIIEKATANKVLLGVAEQSPFLPYAQFCKQLVSSGALGAVYAVQNDFHSYSYHAIAQLRDYLVGKPQRARCTQSTFPSSLIDGRSAQWHLGTVNFDDGSLLLYQFAAHGRAGPGSIRIFGTLGAVHNDVITVTERAGLTHTLSTVRIQSPSGQLSSISADVPDVGKVHWNNPFSEYSFTDEQIAVASLLEGMRLAIREGLPVLYTAQNFLVDIEIIQAFQYSENREGAYVALPLSERRQMAFMLTEPRLWKRKLLKQ